jgi:hypothetical protein
VPGIYAYASTSPLFTGVTQLYEQTGNPVLVDPTNPRTQNLVPYDGHALYATYSAAVIPVETEICQRLSADGDARLWLSVAGDPTFDVRSIDPASVRMLAVASDTKPVLTGGAHTRRHSPRHHFGHGHADTCLVGPDHSIDLVLGFHNRDVLLAAERLLGHPLYDGDLVAITITGRLRPERGGTPIVGESVVVVKGPRRPAPPRSK